MKPALLKGFPLSGHFRVSDSDLSIAMVDIYARWDEPVANAILLNRPTPGIHLGQSTASDSVAVVTMGINSGSLVGTSKDEACQLSSNHYSCVSSGFSSHRRGAIFCFPGWCFGKQ